MYFENEDPDSRGWVLRWEDSEGTTLDQVLESDDPDDLASAEAEAERWLLQQGEAPISFTDRGAGPDA